MSLTHCHLSSSPLLHHSLRQPLGLYQPRQPLGLYQPPKAKDYQQATVVSTDTIEINKINASGFAAYTSGGFVQYNSPVPLDGYTARMAIKDKMRGNEYYRLTTENGDITIDVTGYKIELSISAEVTAGFTFLSGVYDLEMVSPDGVVSQLIYGEVTVAPEVTD